MTTEIILYPLKKKFNHFCSVNNFEYSVMSLEKEIQLKPLI